MTLRNRAKATLVQAPLFEGSAAFVTYNEHYNILKWQLPDRLVNTSVWPEAGWILSSHILNLIQILYNTIFIHQKSIYALLFIY